ncbi:hypothetical protein [Carboxylicivirga marina]|uniref:Uncharacterized protein n=1 Tax=Carboxylicivirga marina TaxID=2800988 RepID=A0ABS1HDT9_9BACT|nr:hypothetical protein [Carboxylicivirga marina]MBK3515819.1 hypothetical protein [Carboxylicivirga marina]
MTKNTNTRYYSVGGIRFKINFLSPFFEFDNQGGSRLFQTDKHSKDQEWTINFDILNQNTLTDFTYSFKGSERFEEELPYKWSIINTNNQDGILIEFEDNLPIKKVIALIDTHNNTINTFLSLFNNAPLTIDPFFHPLGILIIQYIIHQHEGFVIHASSVDLNGKGYLFSAVSGTGKSTMAKIWQSKGATIINDDRLIVVPENDGYRIYNTPMPYYQDRNKSVLLHKAFIIKQSPDNYLNALPVLKGTLGLLGNCMQFQYEESQIQKRLNALQGIAEKCGIYECGFKPDKDIIQLILNEVG